MAYIDLNDIRFDLSLHCKISKHILKYTPLIQDKPCSYSQGIATSSIGLYLSCL